MAAASRPQPADGDPSSRGSPNPCPCRGRSHPPTPHQDGLLHGAVRVCFGGHSWCRNTPCVGDGYVFAATMHWFMCMGVCICLGVCACGCKCACVCACVCMGTSIGEAYIVMIYIYSCPACSLNNCAAVCQKVSVCSLQMAGL